MSTRYVYLPLPKKKHRINFDLKRVYNSHIWAFYQGMWRNRKVILKKQQQPNNGRNIGE